MTVEAFAPSPVYVIAGTGPYGVTHPYRQGALRLAVWRNGIRTELGPADFTVSPLVAEDAGTVTLSAGAAATHAGGSLFITRDTSPEQGWEGASSRERGLEAQLDWITQAVQDIGQVIGRSLRGPHGENLVLELPPVADRRGKVLAFDTAGKPVALAELTSGLVTPDWQENLLDEDLALDVRQANPQRFASRQALIDWIGAGSVPVAGQSIGFTGRVLRGSTGATVLAGLPGVLPPANVADAEMLGLTPGTVTDAVALVNAQRINAWLALADGNVFDFQANDISIGETLRLGRHGNGLIGTSAGDVFGLPTSGAICRWRGADGGTMILCQRSDTNLDVDSPLVHGLTLDGRSLARYGVVWRGTRKPMAGALHVWGIRSNADSYAYLLTGVSNTEVGCVYGGRFGSLTAHVSGLANGFLLTGPVAASGRNVCFNQFDYCHVTCENGFSFVFQKGDDNVFTQLAVSRGAGGTNGALLFNTSVASQLFWVGNKIHNANMGITDGAVMQIVVANSATIGNEMSYNGVDYTPELVFQTDAVRGHNKWRFLGQTNYLGGWTNRPTENLFRFPNVADADPNVLDWYAEGSVTPVLTIGGSSAGIAYASRSMTFTRIGNIVTVRCAITLTSKGGLTGDVAIGGLPHTSAAGGGVAAGISVGYYAGLTAITTAPIGGVAPGTTSILLFKEGAVSGIALGGADITNTFRIEFSATYQAAE